MQPCQGSCESHGHVPCDRQSDDGWQKLRILPLVKPTLQALDCACRFGRNCARGCSARRSCDSAPRVSRSPHVRNSHVWGGCCGRGEGSRVSPLAVAAESPACGGSQSSRCGGSPLMCAQRRCPRQKSSSRILSLSSESVGGSTVRFLVEWNPCFRPVCVDRSVLHVIRGARVRRSFLASLPQE